MPRKSRARQYEPRSWRKKKKKDEAKQTATDRQVAEQRRVSLEHCYFNKCDDTNTGNVTVEGSSKEYCPELTTVAVNKTSDQISEPAAGINTIECATEDNLDGDLWGVGSSDTGEQLSSSQTQISDQIGDPAACINKAECAKGENLGQALSGMGSSDADELSSSQTQISDQITDPAAYTNVMECAEEGNPAGGSSGVDFLAADELSSSQSHARKRKQNAETSRILLEHCYSNNSVETDTGDVTIEDFSGVHSPRSTTTFEVNKISDQNSDLAVCIQTECAEEELLIGDRDLREMGSSEELPSSQNQDYSALYDGALPLLAKALPDIWMVYKSKHGLHLLKMSATISMMAQRSIFVGIGGDFKLFFHSHELKREHEIFGLMPALNFGDAATLSDSLVSAVAQFRLWEVCVGVPEEKYKNMWRKSSDCFIDLNNEQETRYSQTCRSNNCEWAVRQRRRRCGPCELLWRKFAARQNEEGVRPGTSKVATPKKKKPHKFLSSPEKIARLKRSKKVVDNVKRQLSRLQLKLQELISEEGMTLRSAKDEEDMMEMVQEAFKKSTDGSLQKLFIEQQIAASKRKGMRGMRWHPLIVRLALQIRMVSASAYNILRDSGFVKLPSERYLFDYSHVFDAKPGVNVDVINDVAKEVAALTKKVSYQDLHVLMSDEVHISQGLVQKKATGELVGYCNLTEVQQEVQALEEKVKAAGEGRPSNTPTIPKSPPIATKIQSYMVRGVASAVCAVVASYPVSSMTSCDVYDYTWEVIEACESHGIKIVPKVFDGGASNRGFIDLNPPCTSTDSGVVFDTINMYAPERKLFFISDPPHLLKTARNCLYNSGRKESRHMKKNGEPLTWDPIVKLYHEKSELTIKKLHKLNAACVYLNSYSMMNVKLAARVMSGSVANALGAMNWPNTKELRVFVKL